MTAIKFALFGVAIILVIIVIYDYINTRRLIKIGVMQTAETLGFERAIETPKLRLLIIGDSSGVGVGATDPNQSIAGRIASDFPEAEITNLAVSGSKVQDALEQLDQLTTEDQYDLIVLQIGGNDIVRFTKLADLERDLATLLELAKQHSDKVVQLTSGNVGTSQLLPFGTRWLFTIRTKQVRRIFLRVNAQAGSNYVDLYRIRAIDPYVADPVKYYSADFFHPSGAGYGVWYERVQPVIKKLFE